MTALKDTPLSVRVEAGFARRFVAAASADERTVASALRLAMRDYVAERERAPQTDVPAAGGRAKA